MEQYRIALNKLDDIAKGQDIRLRHLENGYHLKSSCFDWVIPFFEERLKRRLKNTYDVRTRLRILSLFLSFIEAQNAKKLEDISINHIAAAFEASTDQNHFRSTIREFLSFAAENGWMPTNLSCFVPKFDVIEAYLPFTVQMILKPVWHLSTVLRRVANVHMQYYLFAPGWD